MCTGYVTVDCGFAVVQLHVHVGTSCSVVDNCLLFCKNALTGILRHMYRCGQTLVSMGGTLIPAFIVVSLCTMHCAVFGNSPFFYLQTTFVSI